MINNIRRGPTANCIALHDFAEESPDIKGWFEYTVNFFEKNGVIPTRMEGPTNSKKTVAFKRAYQQHIKDNFQSMREEGTWLAATPAYDPTDNGEAIFCAWLDVRAHKKNKTFVLSFDNNIIAFNSDTVNEITREFSVFFKSRYGYVYQRAFKKGPQYYPFGVSANLEWGDPERKAITKWGDIYHMPDGSYKTGDLRDIYPMNLLSPAHAQHVVENLPFFDWISASSERGSLTQIDDERWAWWVEPEHIPTVREALRPTGFVTCI